MHDRRGHNHEAYLWQYGRPGGGVMFDFRLGRGRAGPKEVLGDYQGILQTDGYIAYEKTGGPKMVHAACWAHYPERSIIRSSSGGVAADWRLQHVLGHRAPDNYVRGIRGKPAASSMAATGGVTPA